MGIMKKVTLLAGLLGSASGLYLPDSTISGCGWAFGCCGGATCEGGQLWGGGGTCTKNPDGRGCAKDDDCNSGWCDGGDSTALCTGTCEPCPLPCDVCSAGKFAHPLEVHIALGDGLKVTGHVDGLCQCEPCESNKYSLSGSTSCITCDPGKRIGRQSEISGKPDDKSQLTCIPCEKGTYAHDSNQVMCYPIYPSELYQKYLNSKFLNISNRQQIQDCFQSTPLGRNTTELHDIMNNTLNKLCERLAASMQLRYIYKLDTSQAQLAHIARQVLNQGVQKGPASEIYTATPGDYSDGFTTPVQIDRHAFDRHAGRVTKTVGSCGTDGKSHQEFTPGPSLWHELVGGIEEVCCVTPAFLQGDCRTAIESAAKKTEDFEKFAWNEIGKLSCPLCKAGFLTVGIGIQIALDATGGAEVAEAAVVSPGIAAEVAAKAAGTSLKDILEDTPAAAKILGKFPGLVKPVQLFREAVKDFSEAFVKASRQVPAAKSIEKEITAEFIENTVFTVAEFAILTAGQGLIPAVMAEVGEFVCCKTKEKTKSKEKEKEKPKDKPPKKQLVTVVTKTPVSEVVEVAQFAVQSAVDKGQLLPDADYWEETFSVGIGTTGCSFDGVPLAVEYVDGVPLDKAAAEKQDVCSVDIQTCKCVAYCWAWSTSPSPPVSEGEFNCAHLIAKLAAKLEDSTCGAQGGKLIPDAQICPGAWWRRSSELNGAWVADNPLYYLEPPSIYQPATPDGYPVDGLDSRRRLALEDFPRGDPEMCTLEPPSIYQPATPDGYPVDGLSFALEDFPRGDPERCTPSVWNGQANINLGWPVGETPTVVLSFGTNTRAYRELDGTRYDRDMGDMGCWWSDIAPVSPSARNDWLWYGSEIGMQRVIDFKKDLAKECGSPIPQFVYVDAEDLKGRAGQTPGTNIAARGARSPVETTRNNEWKAYYKEALCKCSLVIFFMDEAWQSSQFCWQEYFWAMFNREFPGEEGADIRPSWPNNHVANNHAHANPEVTSAFIVILADGIVTEACWQEAQPGVALGPIVAPQTIPGCGMIIPEMIQNRFAYGSFRGGMLPFPSDVRITLFRPAPKPDYRGVSTYPKDNIMRQVAYVKAEAHGFLRTTPMGLVACPQPPRE